MNKLWFKSRTILFNLAALAAVAIQVGVFETFIPVEYQVVVLVAANLALRYVTSQGITAPSSTDVLEAADSVKSVASSAKNLVLRK